MDFDFSPKVKDMQAKLLAFMDQHIYPNEATYLREVAENRAKGNAWIPTKVIEELKPKARAAGLWNLFLPRSPRAPEGLSNLEYAPLCEIMGRVTWAPEVFNCGAPDTGNMETIERYGSEANKDEWLEPLLKGEIRSAFLMTEPAVASSDATNIECSIRREGDEYVINGRKWWSSGAGDPRCAIYIVMGKTDPEAPRHSQQSMILVPSNAKGVKVLRPLTVFGYDDAPHGHMEVVLDNVHTVGDVLLQAGNGHPALPHNLSCVGQHRAIEQLHQRALPRPVAPHERDALAALDGERGTVEHGGTAEGDGDRLNGEERHAL